jgi:alpha-tubulin suppressor-like RCC1 family protein
LGFADKTRRIAVTALLVLVVGAAGAATSVLAGTEAGGGAAGSSVHAWGEDPDGQLGDGMEVTNEKATPVAVSGISCAVSATVNELDSFAVLGNGTVEAWGADEKNYSGELGDNGALFPHSTTPVPVAGIDTAVGMAADTSDVYVVLANGTLVAWGDNRYGEFGDGPSPPTEETNTPVAIALSVTGVKQISASADSAVLAVLEDGEVDSWGNALATGTLGREGNGLTPAPVEIEPKKNLTGATAVSEGAVFSLALAGGEVKAWGDAGGPPNNVLGDGPKAVPGETPVTVGGVGTPLTGVTAIAAGGNFGLALVGGEVKAWGEGALGQLGDGSTSDSNVPVTVTGLKDIVAIAATSLDGYALDAEGHVWAWGNNNQGELGAASSEKTSDVPVEINDLGAGNTALATGSGAQHEMALGPGSTVCGSSTGPGGETKTEPTPTNGGGSSSTSSPTSNPNGAGSAASAAAQSATNLALQCSDRKLALTDVVERNRRVLLDGVAVASLDGQTVKIIFDGHQQVATAKIGAQGQFATSAPLPPPKLRDSNSARYTAESGSLQSLNLKLTRRLILDPLSSSAGKVALSGQVIPPLGKPIAQIDVEQQLNCAAGSVVARIKPSASGRFSIELAAPTGAQAALYRLSTKVRENASSNRLFATDSLPETVGLP